MTFDITLTLDILARAREKNLNAHIQTHVEQVI